MSSGAYSLRLARTLYENVYHAMLYNENQQPIGDLEIIPNIPLETFLHRSYQLPALQILLSVPCLHF